MSCNKNTCGGCYPYFQPNQIAHMEQGGCLACDEDDEFNCEPRNLEEQFNNVAQEEEEKEEEEQKEEEEEKERPELFTAPIDLGDCPICFDKLKMIDITVTKCGHTFHSSCIFKSLDRNVDCPMCRTELIHPESDDDEEEDDEEDDEYNEEEENEEDNEEDNEDEDEEDNEEVDEEPKVTIEQLSVKLQNMGYTFADILTLHMRWYLDGAMKREDETRSSDKFLEELIKKIDGVTEGRITMSHRDQRTYAQVLQPQQPQPQHVVLSIKDLERVLLTRRNTQEA